MIEALLAVAGLAVGYGTNVVITKRRIGSAEIKAEKELEKAKKEANKLIEKAREESKKKLMKLAKPNTHVVVS